jgi:hypothetical protein
MIISPEEAKEIAQNALHKTRSRIDNELVIQDKFTVEFETGWVFYYQSRKYLETGDILFRLMGNGPIIIDKEEGLAYQAGTGEPVQYWIEEFKKNKDNFPRL